MNESDRPLTMADRVWTAADDRKGWTAANLSTHYTAYSSPSSHYPFCLWVKTFAEWMNSVSAIHGDSIARRGRFLRTSAWIYN